MARITNGLPQVHPALGIEPAARACALTGDRTRDRTGTCWCQVDAQPLARWGGWSGCCVLLSSRVSLSDKKLWKLFADEPVAGLRVAGELPLPLLVFLFSVWVGAGASSPLWCLPPEEPRRRRRVRCSLGSAGAACSGHVSSTGSSGRTHLLAVG